MDFFETVVFLVKEDRIPERFAKHTFLRDFDAYYQASKLEFDLEKSADSEVYEDVDWLHDRWSSDPAFNTSGKLKKYFSDEANRGKCNDK